MPCPGKADRDGGLVETCFISKKGTHARSAHALVQTRPPGSDMHPHSPAM